MLSQPTIDSVRAAQVIGCHSRAIEELVRNSILHGKATVIDVILDREKREALSNGGRKGRTTLVPTLQVKDNGIGIDGESLDKFVGTHYCTTQEKDNATKNHGATGVFQQGSFDRVYEKYCKRDMKGESLKSLACLCLEMQIETCFEIKKPTREKNSSSSPFFSRRNAITSAPSKRRRRQEQEFDDDYFCCSPLPASSNSSGVRTDSRGYHQYSKKIIQNGIKTSFQSSSQNDSSVSSLLQEQEQLQHNRQNENYSTLRKHKERNTIFLSSSLQHDNKSNKSSQLAPPGTIIKIFGLFHNHEVRRKHENLIFDHHAPNNDGASTALVAKAKSCVQTLALAFPTITIRLFLGREKISSWSYGSKERIVLDSSLSYRSWKSEDALSKEFFKGLRQRFIQLCCNTRTPGNSADRPSGCEAKSKQQLLNVVSNKSFSVASTRCNLYGILRITNRNSKEEDKLSYEQLIGSIDRKTTIASTGSFIFLNGRPVENDGDTLATVSTILNLCNRSKLFDDSCGK